MVRTKGSDNVNLNLPDFPLDMNGQVITIIHGLEDGNVTYIYVNSGVISQPNGQSESVLKLDNKHESITLYGDNDSKMWYIIAEVK